LRARSYVSIYASITEGRIVPFCKPSRGRLSSLIPGEKGDTPRKGEEGVEQ